MKKSFGRLGLTTVLVLVFSFPATGSAAEATFVTNSPAMLTGVGNVSVKPLVTVGDILPGGLKFEGIPDGIAIDPREELASTSTSIMSYRPSPSVV